MSQEDPQEEGKARAGREAADRVQSDMRVGLGTGSTVFHFLSALGRRIRTGELRGILGVPTSLNTQELAEQ